MSASTRANSKPISPLHRKVRLFFTGLTMGLADLVPGVSGGTIAFLLGIYEELLYTIRLITGRVIRLIIKGRFKEAYQIIPFGFIIPLAAGAVTTIFGFAQIIEFLLTTQPLFVWAFFFGLVLGSAYVISRRIDHWNVRRVVLLAIGFLLTFLLVGIPSLGGNSSLLAIFGTGMIAITAMILPGISGSLIMVLLGQYEIVITAISERNFVTIAVFGLGAVLGLALFVRLLSWLLKRYHFAVIALLIGVMLGSLRRVWPWQEVTSDGIMTSVIPNVSLSFVLAILLIVISISIVLFLDRIGIAKEHVHDIKSSKE